MTDPNAIAHPLAQRITALRLPGMRDAFLEQMERRDLDDMPFEERLALLIDREVAERRSRALQRRLKKAQLRHADACFEDINLSRPRGLDRSVVLGLGDCAWVRNATNILITGPCGTGKSSYEGPPVKRLTRRGLQHGQASSGGRFDVWCCRVGTRWHRSRRAARTQLLSGRSPAVLPARPSIPRAAGATFRRRDPSGYRHLAA